MSPPVSTNEPLTAKESRDLAAAVRELTEEGQHEAARHLGELARDPAALRKVLAEEGAGADA